MACAQEAADAWDVGPATVAAMTRALRAGEDDIVQVRQLSCHMHYCRLRGLISLCAVFAVQWEGQGLQVSACLSERGACHAAGLFLGP